MKQKICVLIFLICLLLMAGIVGGVDCGQPTENLKWCMPLLFVMLISGYVGDFYE